MSALHPTDEDEAFAAGHADAGLRKALRRIERLEALLDRVLTVGNVYDNSNDLYVDINKALSMTYYDEVDDGRWRLPKSKDALVHTKRPPLDYDVLNDLARALTWRHFQAGSPEAKACTTLILAGYVEIRAFDEVKITPKGIKRLRELEEGT